MTEESTPLHRNVVKVIEAGRALGVEVVPRSYPQGAKTAQDAADAIGVDVGQIVKSLIFGVASGDPDGHLELVMAYVSGSNQLDEKKLGRSRWRREVRTCRRRHRTFGDGLPDRGRAAVRS